MSKKKQALLATLEGNPVRDWDSASKLLLARLLITPDLCRRCQSSRLMQSNMPVSLTYSLERFSS